MPSLTGPKLLEYIDKYSTARVCSGAVLPADHFCSAKIADCVWADEAAVWAKKLKAIQRDSDVWDSHLD